MVLMWSMCCWDEYYYSYLQVVNNQSVANAGYILNAYSLTSSFISPFAGLLIRQTGRFFAGLPFIGLGTALLIVFRTPGSSPGYLAMCQVFNGIAGGVFSMCAQIAVMTTVSHQEVAIALAMYGLFGSIGAAVGQTIAGALWTNILPAKIYEHLPEGSKNLTANIYGSLTVQLSYPMGSPIRDAIIKAYADVQRWMVISGAVFIPLLVVCLFMWKSANVKTVEDIKGQQSKGTVW
ncbi:siderophore iron transporter mirB [Thozetella sp. PMI_491]|nr:siderophore iron transporter mirB [Thozetella sp. PMI_491]